VIRAAAAVFTAGLTLTTRQFGVRADSLSRWLRWNAAARTATLTLIPGYGNAYNGFNFNGYGKGQVLVTIPRGWMLVVGCENSAASTNAHSCAIVRSPGAQRPVIKSAATPGVPPGKSATFTFHVTRPATYRIVSLVPNDELAGMWTSSPSPRSGSPRSRSYAARLGAGV
jgi:Sulfocyanin (SoxE) domain